MQLDEKRKARRAALKAAVAARAAQRKAQPAGPRRPKARKPKVSVKHLVTVGGRQFVTGSMLSASNDSNGGAGQSPVNILPAKLAADQLIEVMRNPFMETSDADWPDPFTLVPTRKSKDIVHQSLTIANGATANDGGVAMYVRGDPYHAWGVPSSISSDGTINWAGCTQDMNASMPTNVMARPIAIGHRFTFSAVGPFHTIVARVMELPPWGPVSSAYANFPTKTSLGPTFAQREFFRAREVTLAPGETLEVNCYPADADCLVFATTGQEREATSVSGHAKSWSGFVLWVHGLTSADTIYHDGIIRHSWYMPSPVTAPSVSPTPATLTHPSAAEKDRALSTTVDDVSNGWNVFKSIISGVAEFALKALPYLAGAGQVQLAPPMSATAYPPTTLGCYAVMSDSGAPKHLMEVFGKPSLVATRMAEAECKEFVRPNPLCFERAVEKRQSPPEEKKDDGFEDLTKSVLIKALRQNKPTPVATM